MTTTLARFEMPSRLVKDESTALPTYAKYVAEPFEQGYGHTIGNSLRRVLLSSLEGAAITSVKIAGAQHEFTTIPGVLEDMTDIVLNVKSLVVKNHDFSALNLKDINFNHVYPQLQRLFNGSYGVFRFIAHCSAMANNKWV